MAAIRTALVKILFMVYSSETLVKANLQGFIIGFSCAGVFVQMSVSNVKVRFFIQRVIDTKGRQSSLAIRFIAFIFANLCFQRGLTQGVRTIQNKGGILLAAVIAVFRLLNNGTGLHRAKVPARGQPQTVPSGYANTCRSCLLFAAHPTGS